MDPDDFADWQLCWQANLLFHKRVTKSQKCIVCSEAQDYANNTRRSSFWLDATRCLAGHRQATQIETQGTPCLGVCATCDQMYMLDIVHEVELRERLESDKALLENFLALLRKYRIYECAIHCDEVAYNTNPFLALKPPTTQCDHDRNACDACLKAALESAIRGGRLQDLVCPDPECKKPIPLEAIRSNISTDVFKIYNKQLALKTIAKDENFRWCACGHGQIHSLGESNPEWICLSCSKRHCYICKEESSMPCEHLRAIDAQKNMEKTNRKESAARIFSEAAKKAEEAQRQARDNEAGTKREIARTTKKCPKAGCCNKIERNDGCGHFTCKMCLTEFCWCCKVIWKNNNVLHLVGCRIGTKSQVEKSKLDQAGYAVGWDRDEGYDLSLDKGLWLLGSHM
ncbi:hypothetical protein BDZ45DRAFT_754513 [Acephala macrosclerotiorum]|nr:hypothetical protein BDZ45DRAFT_754513 [Acephala macrosclerotiorum]